MIHLYVLDLIIVKVVYVIISHRDICEIEIRFVE
jgi:hypothetical protein